MPKLPSQQYTFDRVPAVNIPRCSLRRPSSYKTTLGVDALYPVFLDEVLPGDTFNLDVSTVCRLTTPLVPILDNLWLDWQFFFVPSRLIWDHFPNMCGETSGPSDERTWRDYSVPQVHTPEGGFAVGSIYDYMGIPTGVNFGSVSALPLRAYVKVWNEWYRDEDLQDEIPLDTGDDDPSSSDFWLLPRAKQKEYFTSARPWPQKGPEISLPLSGTFPVVGTGDPIGLVFSDRADPPVRSLALGRSVQTASTSYSPLSATTAPPSQLYVGEGNPSLLNVSGTPFVGGVTTDPSESGLVALTGDGVGSINEFREAFQLQKMLERDARSGSRYLETIHAHFGVRNPDARLQRSEFLGSFSVPINFHSVAQTSGTGDTPQGNLAAFATGSAVKKGFVKSFTEFGYVIGLVSCRADITYQQGLHRLWSRRLREELIWPEFSHLGEQTILNKEIFVSDESSVDSSGVALNDKAFGYQERYAEMKFGWNRVTGELRSTYAQSLDYWHLAEKFENLPVLNEEFIWSRPPVSRALAVTDAPAFLLDVYYDLKCVRPLPLYSVPGLIDHF